MVLRRQNLFRKKGPATTYDHLSEDIARFKRQILWDLGSHPSLTLQIYCSLSWLRRHTPAGFSVKSLRRLRSRRSDGPQVNCLILKLPFILNLSQLLTELGRSSHYICLAEGRGIICGSFVHCIWQLKQGTILRQENVASNKEKSNESRSADDPGIRVILQ